MKELSYHERRKMDKYFKETFQLTEEEDLDVEWDIDVANSVCYHWKFVIPNGKHKGKYRQTYDYSTRTVSHVKLR